MGKALYRKYRSKSLSEIIGQEHITDTLSTALKQGNISHAYLFTGPRGVGKTSIARILAHEVNGLPYSEEQPHLDIIEIDAASNRRIDEIRELKDRVQVAPTSAKYKVYIIDEVHMLTREAFNALLKTLEEPPDHAIFILATTEAHKVPETIISRTQRFTFKPVSPEKVIAHLKAIAKQENIKIDEEALELIAAHGDGSFRDSIGLLDQLRHISDHIKQEHAQQALGQASKEMLNELLKNIRAGNLPAMAEILSGLNEQGVQATQTARQISQMLRQDVISERTLLPQKTSLELLHELASIPAASEPNLKLELALYGTALSFSDEGSETFQEAKPVSTPKTAASRSDSKQNNSAKPDIEKVAPDLSASNVTGELNPGVWPNVLTAIKSKHNTLYGITRMAQPRFEPGKLTLVFSFGFHHKRLSETKNQQTLLKIIKEITGQDVLLDCVIDKSLHDEPLNTGPVNRPVNTDLETISNIFGSAEVVE